MSSHRRIKETYKVQCLQLSHYRTVENSLECSGLDKQNTLSGVC